MKWFRAAAGFTLFSIFLLATASETNAIGSRLSALAPFNGVNGSFPTSSLMRATDGNFYGTTDDGGASNLGTIFRMTPAGVITVLHSFPGTPGGDAPKAGLIQATDGNFYGTTYFGGAFGLGTVFRMTPGGAVTIIHSFEPAPDGARPRAAVLQASDGNLYGTTEFGGVRGRGTLFGMTLAGATFFRYQFSGAADGAYPYAPVVQARNGQLYGTVYGGDTSRLGRVFRLSGTTVAVVHTFLGGAADGANPIGGLMEGTDGFFYGTTHFGGSFNQGTAYKMTPAGAVTVVKSFSGGADGGSPDTSLIQPRDGNFYGAAKIGGIGYGTLFQMTPAGVVTTLHTFSGGADGANPSAALIEGAGGALFGTAANGGSSSKGLVFRLATDIAGAARGDFDGDGRAELSVFRPSNGTWYVRSPSDGSSLFTQWGVSGDVPVAGDFDGDGRSDHAVWRPSNGIWFVKQSGNGSSAFLQWGINGDVPVPADYDGDGITDVAVFRPSTSIWYIINSATNTTSFQQWGISGDFPVADDYDGDGKDDVAVWRPSTGIWYIRNSSNATLSFLQWGLNSDIAVPGDYDGDGRADAAVFRPSTGIWYVRDFVTNTARFYQWGLNGDIPVPVDYDGDGRTDVAVFRPSTAIWYVINTSTGASAFFQWGLNGDIPIPRRP